MKTLVEFATEIPRHLRPYLVNQEYPRYTPIDHAVWRYVMRQNRAYLKHHAHPIYEEGLAAAGIYVDRIPDIDEMNACMQAQGWRVVSVAGFIPPSIFMEFQAHAILPVACDIRTLDHLSYTPAPDIIHESAGHAPILKDPEFSEFQKYLCELGAKALANREDQELYEAIRHLSIIKEDPKATVAQIEEAENRFREKQAAVGEASEAAQVARFYWWTIEYGLIGEVDVPRIYGAGLLSSVGESKRCLTPLTKKVPFDLDEVLHTSYDITTYQPKLFVCKSFAELLEAARVLAGRMAFTIGGTRALEQAVGNGQKVAVVYQSGLQVNGELGGLIYDERQEAVYLKMVGPTSLALSGQTIAGHGHETHPHGFGSPIGMLEDVETAPERLSEAQCKSLGIIAGQETTLTFASGVQVKGRVRSLMRHEGQLVLISFDDCTVTHHGDVLFMPEWGCFDMAVGHRVQSVFALHSESDAEENLKMPYKTLAERTVTPTEEELELQGLYKSVRVIRETAPPADVLETEFAKILDRVRGKFGDHWLVRLEMLEVLKAREVSPELQERLETDLAMLAQHPDRQELIANGLAILGE